MSTCQKSEENQIQQILKAVKQMYNNFKYSKPEVINISYQLGKPPIEDINFLLYKAV